jgi:hypothetical protein
MDPLRLQIFVFYSYFCNLRTGFRIQRESQEKQPIRAIGGEKTLHSRGKGTFSDVAKMQLAGGADIPRIGI